MLRGLSDSPNWWFKSVYIIPLTHINPEEQFLRNVAVVSSNLPFHGVHASFGDSSQKTKPLTNTQVWIHDDLNKKTNDSVGKWYYRDVWGILNGMNVGMLSNISEIYSVRLRWRCRCLKEEHRCVVCIGWTSKNYPLVNWHRPCQIGVGRLVSTKNWCFSGSMFIYQSVTYTNHQKWRHHGDVLEIFNQ